MKRLIIALAALMLLSGCAAMTDKDAATEAPKIVTFDVTTQAIPEETAPPTQETAPPETEPLPVYPEADIGEVSYDSGSFSEVFEAEDGLLFGYAAVTDHRSGYSGTGYVSGASLPDSGIIIQFPVECAQHYDITVCAACNSPVEGVLYVDSLARGKISLSGTGEFEAVKFENIYLSPDEAMVSIGDLSGECDIDFIWVESTNAVAEHDYSVSGELSNKRSSEIASKEYKYLCEMYGEAIFSAQQCTPGSNAEIEAIAHATGRYPAIRFGELMGYSEGLDTGDIELAIDYYQSGGLVGYVWNWMQNGSCYREKSGFELKNAVTDHDVAHFSQEKIAELRESHGVSEECERIIEGIDLIAEQLKRLKEENIPVIFRPLPEAGNPDFWWNEDKDSYLWLYRLMYVRLCEYHSLDNIIWVWNGVDTDWYVGDELCDIVSLNIYDFSGGAWDNQSYITPMLRLYELTTDKPLAISECNVLPGPANIVKDKAYWLYSCVWSDEYAISEDGKVCLDHMTEAEWILFYNCSQVLARDELTFGE